MSSWSPEPGMWALSQVGLAPGLRAGGGVSSGTIRGQRAACSEAVCFCVGLWAGCVRSRHQGRIRRDSLVSWD